MDVTTCEQYVLAELEAALAANERLAQENERLQAQLQILEANARPSRTEAYVIEAGRRSVFDSLTYAGVTDAIGEDGQPIPFDAWCEDSMRDYARPKWLSTAEFVRFFEPEFRRAYEKRLEEAGS